jgi:phage-related protein
MTSPHKLTAHFYKSSSGAEPVRDGLRELDLMDRKAVGEDIAYVQYQWPLGKPRVDHLHGGVWEVRCKLANRIARVLFAVEGAQMVLLHAFIKKTQKTPKQELDLG